MTEIRRGYYEFEFIVIEGGDNSQEVIDAYAKLLEENITAQPTLWLWSHRRWKLKNIAMNDKSKTLSLSQN
jgi:KDO2-lipid IV(A) lauroyltransferase